MRVFTLLLLSWLLAACTGLPEGVEPVRPFDANRYLGTWYEIARLDHSFERGLEQVSANYSLREDGGIRVLNKGYSAADGEWQQAEGKAYLIGPANEGYLKVSFFGPFYSGYNVIALDKDYKYALVSGQSLDYLWILSRTTTIPDDVKQQYLKLASDLGYKTENLI